MKKFAKLMSVVLSGILAIGIVGVSAGCNKKKKDTVDFIELQAYDRGYGTQGLNAVAARYMELHPEITIDIEGVVDNTLATDIYAGPKASTIDLYFNGGANIYNLVTAGQAVIDGVTYPNYVEPLTEVYNYTPEGETKPIKEKMLNSYEETFNLKKTHGGDYTEDTYYTASWVGGNIGLVYNSKMFTEKNWNVPVTTDELLTLCDTILATQFTSTNKNSQGESIKVVPFGYCLADSYWTYVYHQWWAQYDGVKSYVNFYKGQNVDGVYTHMIANTTGRYEMIKLMDALLGTYKEENGTKVARTNVYCDPTLATRTFIDTQSTFLNAEGARINTQGATTYAMMPNGDWLESEMSANFGEKMKNGELEFKMMKTPVISSIINHADCEGTISDDAELVALIKAIDNGSTELTGEGYSVSEKAFNKIKEARNLTLGNWNNNIYIPSFATAKEAAKDFLKFYFSDEGIRIFSEATGGQNLPVEYDWSTINGVTKFYESKFDVISNVENYVGHYDVFPAIYLGGLVPFPEYLPFESKFNVSSEKDYLSPLTVFTDNFNSIQRSWANIVKDAGLN